MSAEDRARAREMKKELKARMDALLEGVAELQDYVLYMHHDEVIEHRPGHDAVQTHLARAKSSLEEALHVAVLEIAKRRS